MRYQAYTTANQIQRISRVEGCSVVGECSQTPVSQGCPLEPAICDCRHCLMRLGNDTVRLRLPRTRITAIATPFEASSPVVLSLSIATGLFLVMIWEEKVFWERQRNVSRTTGGLIRTLVNNLSFMLKLSWNTSVVARVCGRSVFSLSHTMKYC